MQTITSTVDHPALSDRLSAITVRFRAYQSALRILSSSGTTVSARKEAIAVRDGFLSGVEGTVSALLEALEERR